MGRFKEFIGERRRVLQVTKRPDKQEFTTIVKISALGIAVIGLIGFIITMIATVIRGV